MSGELRKTEQTRFPRAFTEIASEPTAWF
jgi:hypothetical protein